MTELLVANPINDPPQIAVAFGRLLRGIGLELRRALAAVFRLVFQR